MLECFVLESFMLEVDALKFGPTFVLVACSLVVSLAVARFSCCPSFLTLALDDIVRLFAWIILTFKCTISMLFGQMHSFMFTDGREGISRDRVKGMGRGKGAKGCVLRPPCRFHQRSQPEIAERLNCFISRDVNPLKQQ
jgi:hypothetical protein